jgi:hypothetical protein
LTTNGTAKAVFTVAAWFSPLETAIVKPRDWKASIFAGISASGTFPPA